MLELRVLLVGGYSGLVAFHSLHKKPLMIPLCWSAIFVAVNAAAAVLLVADRYAPTLNTPTHPDGEALYEEYFQGLLTRGQFLQLLDMARRERLPTGTVLTRENQVCDKMYFIVKGQARVFHGRTHDLAVEEQQQQQQQQAAARGNDDATIASSRRRTSWSTLQRNMTLSSNPPNIATIEQGGFVNDVAFSSGGTNVGAYGTVIVSSSSGNHDNSDNADEENGRAEVLTWDTAELRQHLASRKDMERNMKYCMSDHLVKSLLRQREAAHRRQQMQPQQS